MRSISSFLFIFLFASISLASENLSQQIWAKEIRGKTANAILDNHEVIEMIAFTGREGTKIYPRSAAIASVLFRICSVLPLRDSIQPEMLQQRAVLLAQRNITAAEIESVNKFYKSLMADYYKCNPPSTSGALRMDITFGLGAVRTLNNTIENAKNTVDALHRLATLHGWYGQIQISKDATFDNIRMAIERRIPVLLEKDDKLRICFGFIHKEGQNLLLLAVPEIMPFQVGQILFPKEDMESISPFVVKARRNDCKAYAGQISGRLPDRNLQANSCRRFSNRTFRARQIHDLHSDELAQIGRRAG